VAGSAALSWEDWAIAGWTGITIRAAASIRPKEKDFKMRFMEISWYFV
jgi:hypothetical protein